MNIVFKNPKWQEVDKLAIWYFKGSQGVGFVITEKKKNLASSREEGLKPRPLDYKPRAFTTKPYYLKNATNLKDYPNNHSSSEQKLQ